MQNRALYGIGLFASLTTLGFGCSAESADPAGGTGGTVTTSTGGITSTNTGGTVTTSTGGTTSTNTGGTTSTSTGGTTTTATGGTTSTTTGGTTTTATGGTTTTGTGGTTTATGGATTATGGTTTATGGGTATGGTSTAGTTGTGGATAGCSDGCAELRVPFPASGYKSAQAFEIYLAAPVDFSTGVVTVKLRTTAGKAGGIQVILKNGSPNYAWAQTSWLGISDTVKADWTTVTLDASAPPSMDATNVFDKTQVTIIAVQIAAGDPWYSDTAMTMVDPTALISPTIVQVDSITVAGATGAGPYDFTMNATDLHVGTYMATGVPAIVGATVAWLPPG